MAKHSRAAGASSSRFVTDVRHLPLIFNSPDDLRIKDENGGDTGPSSTGFWNMFDRRGASAVLASGVRATLLEVTGASGFIGNLIGPATAAMDSPTKFIVTIDGKESVVEASNKNNSSTGGPRLIVGHIAGGNHVVNSSNDSSVGAFFRGGYYDDNFAGIETGDHGGVNYAGYVTQVAIFTPEILLGAGAPLLWFEKSVKVEVECSAVSNQTVARKTAGVTYALR